MGCIWQWISLSTTHRYMFCSHIYIIRNKTDFSVRTEHTSLQWTKSLSLKSECFWRCCILLNMTITLVPVPLSQVFSFSKNISETGLVKSLGVTEEMFLFNTSSDQDKFFLMSPTKEEAFLPSFWRQKQMQFLKCCLKNWRLPIALDLVSGHYSSRSFYRQWLGLYRFTNSVKYFSDTPMWIYLFFI